MYREDYVRAGYLVLPASELKDRYVVWQCLLPALGLFVVAIVPALRGQSGIVYFAGALVLGGFFLYYSSRFALQRNHRIPRQKLKLEYDDVAQWNPRLIYADLIGFGEKGPDAALPGFDLTAYWARSGLLFLTRDAGSPPTWPVAGSGDNATAVCIYAAIATALYRRERTGKRSYVTTSPWQRVSGRPASSSRPLYAVRISMGCTIERIPQMHFEHVSLFRWHLVRSRGYSGQGTRSSEGNRS